MEVYGCEKCGGIILPQYYDYRCGCGNTPPYPKMKINSENYRFRCCENCGEVVGLPTSSPDFRTEKCPKCRRVGSLVALR